MTAAADWLVAHRGWPARYPENSLVGMHAALEAGARYLECDVQLSADGVPVVFHDPYLFRITGQQSRVADWPFPRLAMLDAGEAERFGDRFLDTRIPSLAALLALLVQYPQATLFVEFKPAATPDDAARLVAAVLALLPQAGGQTVLISYDAHMLTLARERNKSLPIGWVFEPWRDIIRAEAEQLAPDYLFTSAAHLPNHQASSDLPFWPGPWRWALYEVHTPAEAERWHGLGADFIETDDVGTWLNEL